MGLALVSAVRFTTGAEFSTDVKLAWTAVYSRVMSIMLPIVATKSKSLRSAPNVLKKHQDRIYAERSGHGGGGGTLIMGLHELNSRRMMMNRASTLDCKGAATSSESTSDSSASGARHCASSIRNSVTTLRLAPPTNTATGVTAGDAVNPKRRSSSRSRSPRLSSSRFEQHEEDEMFDREKAQLFVLLYGEPSAYTSAEDGTQSIVHHEVLHYVYGSAGCLQDIETHNSFS